MSANAPLAFVRRLLILVVLYALPGAFLALPVGDHDIWWHLRTGQWVVEHGTVPVADPFAHTTAGQPWIAYSWLFEVLVYGIYRAGGLAGLFVFRLVLSYVVLVALHRFVIRREPRFFPAALATALAFTALCPILTERPWLFTILFGLWTLEAVLRLRDGSATRLVVLLPFVYALWGNLHIQFVYGLVLLGLGCVAPLFDAVLKRPTSGRFADTFLTRPWWHLVGLTAACAVAPLLNPYGIGVYRVIFEYAGQSEPYGWVNELLSPEFRQPYDWALLTLALAAAFALGRRAQLSAFEVLLLAGTAYTAFRSRRDNWFLVLAALTILTGGPRAAPAPADRFRLPRWGWAVVVFVVACFVAVRTADRGLVSEADFQAAVAKDFPADAVAHIREEAYPGPLFNFFDWGGYLIWALPERPVSVDGRNNLHGDERLRRHFRTCKGLEFEADEELLSARLAIVAHTTPLPALLRNHPRFREVYSDKLAAVFVARDP